MRSRLVPSVPPRARLSGFSAPAIPPQVSARADGSIASLNLSGRTWSLDQTDLVQFKTWNTATRTLTTWTPADCETFTASGGGFTATILGGAITITGAMPADGEDLRETLVVANSHPTVAVHSIQYPRLHVQPPSGISRNAYITIPIWAGFVKREPSLDTADSYVSSPSCLGFFSYFDKVAKASLYIEKRDDTGYLVDFHYQGDGASGTLLVVDHFCGANKTAGNDWTQPYEIRIAGLTTKGDGRTAYIDAANRYASWALAVDEAGDYIRPWIPSDYWWLRTDNSSRVRNAEIFIAHQDAATAGNTSPPSWSGYLTDLQRTKAFLGSDGTDVLNVIYGWHGNVFDVNIPAHTPARSGYAAHLANVVSEGAHPMPYVNVAYWDLDVTSGTYNVTNFSAFGDVRTYLSKDDDQTIRQDGGHLAILDPSFGVTSGVWLALLSLYYAEAPTAPHGYYFDQIGGTTTSLSLNYSTDLSANTGNAGQWSAGKRTGINGVMGAARLVDSAAGAITEQMDEATLGLDAVLSCQNVDIAAGIGTMCGASFAVYGQFQRHLDFSVQFANPSSSAGALGYAQQVIGHWLGGGLLGYHNGAIGSFVPALNTAAPSIDAALWYTFVVMRALYEAADRTRDAFRGREQRPLADSWQLRAIDNRDSLAAYLVANQVDFPSSVWKTDDGVLWVIVVNHLATTDPFTLTLRCTDYDMPEGRSKSLAIDTGSGFATVATVVDAVSYTDTIPNPVTIFRITTT